MNDPRYPSFWTAIALFLLSQGVGVLTTAALTPIPGIGGFEGLDIVGSLVGYGAAIGVVLWRSGRPVREVLPLHAIGGVGLVVVVATTLGLLVVESELDALLVSVWPVPEWFERLYDDLFAGGASVVGFARVALVAPVAEELLVRGAFLSAFVRRYGSRRALVLSALVFAIAHGNPWQAVPAFFAGLLFGWWTLRSGSLVPALVGHLVGNAVIYVVTVHPSGVLDETAEWTSPERIPPGLLVSGIAVLVAGILASRRVFRKPVTYAVRTAEGAEA